ncbi:MAG TPA: VOC family protein [Propionibacteriaceae bacterium]|nr:VOC family protein [Propionibacteriaceae bacterium]
MTPIRWIHLVLDVPDEGLAEAKRFWAAVSRSTVSDSADGGDGHTTLLPQAGSPWLRLSRTDSEFPGAHLDLVVDDPDAAAAEALGLGAREVDGDGGLRRFRSPAGVLFCLLPSSPDAAGVQDRSPDVLVDQACLDVPSPRFDEEVDFWHALTGWAVQPARYPEFSALARPAGVPVRLSFQRVGDPEAGIHPDLACRRSKLAQREHEELGAVFDHRRPRWTVMVGPSGVRYCLTDRDPATGLWGQPPA